jgi:hypothetical protein
MTTCPQSDAAANGPNAKEELYKLAAKLERENCKLKEELEINTQEIDSYGVEGSNFRICSYCQSESGAGMLDNGIPHDAACILANK